MEKCRPGSLFSPPGQDGARPSTNPDRRMVFNPRGLPVEGHG